MDNGCGTKSCVLFSRSGLFTVGNDQGRMHQIRDGTIRNFNLDVSKWNEL